MFMVVDANIINSYVPGIEILVEATPGTVANLALLQAGKIDLTLAECVPTYENMKAIGAAEGNKPWNKANCSSFILILFFSNVNGYSTSSSGCLCRGQHCRG